MNQTKEDQAINRRIAAHLGTWEFGDATEPARVIARHSRVRQVTQARRIGRPAIVCIGWEEMIK